MANPAPSAAEAAARVLQSALPSPSCTTRAAHRFPAPPPAPERSMRPRSSAWSSSARQPASANVAAAQLGPALPAARGVDVAERERQRPGPLLAPRGRRAECCMPRDRRAGGTAARAARPAVIRGTGHGPDQRAGRPVRSRHVPRYSMLHLVGSQPVHASLGFLLDHLPPGLHPVLASRADPPLPWRACGPGASSPSCATPSCASRRRGGGLPARAPAPTCPMPRWPR